MKATIYKYRRRKISGKKISAIEKLYEECRQNLGYVYTPEEFGKNWWEPKYPNLFVGFKIGNAMSQILEKRHKDCEVT